MVGKIFSGIKNFFEALFKIIASVLLVLGLWIPLLYSIAFLLICAVSGISLNGGVTAVYLVGLALAGAGAVLFAFFRLRGKQKEKAADYAARGSVSAVKRKKEYDLEPPQRQDGEGAALKAKREPAADRAASAHDKEQTHGREQPLEEDKNGALGAEEKQRLYREKYLGAGRPSQDEPLQEAPAAKTVTAVAEKTEQPRVFRLRSDPTLRVYEYSDRLEYYRFTRQGLVLHEIIKK